MVGSLALPASAWAQLDYEIHDLTSMQDLLGTAAHYSVASGHKMNLKGAVCGPVANASEPPGNYSRSGPPPESEKFDTEGPAHSRYTKQKFACQWGLDDNNFPGGCLSNPANEPSDQLFVDIAAASNMAKYASPNLSDRSFPSIDTKDGNVTIVVNGGDNRVNLINIPGNPFNGVNGWLQVRGAGDLIIDGPADAIVIFNIGSDNEGLGGVNKISGGMIVDDSSILLSGGVKAQNVLFNVLAGDVKVNGGPPPGEVINGTILVRAGSDVKGKFTGQGVLRINGAVLGDGNNASEFLIDDRVLVCPPK